MRTTELTGRNVERRGTTRHFQNCWYRGEYGRRCGGANARSHGACIGSNRASAGGPIGGVAAIDDGLWFFREGEITFGDALVHTGRVAECFFRGPLRPYHASAVLGDSEDSPAATYADGFFMRYLSMDRLFFLDRSFWTRGRSRRLFLPGFDRGFQGTFGWNCFARR